LAAINFIDACGAFALDAKFKGIDRLLNSGLSGTGSIRTLINELFDQHLALDRVIFGLQSLTLIFPVKSRYLCVSFLSHFFVDLNNWELFGECQDKWRACVGHR